MDFFDIIDKRHSVRKFKRKEIEKEKLDKILNAMNSAPSAGNLQSYKVFITRGEKFAEAVYQEFIKDAPLVLVFCTDPQGYGERGEKLYSVQDATIAACFAQLAATNLGLGSCWIGAFDEEKVKQVLKTEKRPVVILPIGYPDEKPGKTERKNMDEIVEKR